MQSSESTDSHEDDLAALFTAAISSLAEGNLMFPPPFDLASSAALAVNDDVGDVAEKLFDVTAQRDTGFRIAIHAVAPGVVDRQVIACTVASTSTLLALLDSLIEEHNTPC